MQKLEVASVLHAASKPVRGFCGQKSKPNTRVSIMADEDAAQATAAQLAEPLLEHANEAPVNRAPEQSAEVALLDATDAEAPESAEAPDAADANDSEAPEQPRRARRRPPTILGVGINEANAIVGSGINGLPAALKDAGLGLGCLRW